MARRPLFTLYRDVARQFFTSPVFQDYSSTQDRWVVCCQEARWLCHATQDEKILSQWVKQRLQGMPVARILGEMDFWNSTFVLSPETLIPRPETEGLVSLVRTLYASATLTTLLDLGTGSGCILLSLLQEFPQAQGWGMDISATTLQNSARINATRLALSPRVQWIHQDWAQPWPFTQIFSCIVCNPPYVALKDKPELNVHDHDPFQALYGGDQGYDAYVVLLPKTAQYISAQGYVVWEIGHTQKEKLQNLATKYFHTVWFEKDLHKCDRYMVCQKPKCT